MSIVEINKLLNEKNYNKAEEYYFKNLNNISFNDKSNLFIKLIKLQNCTLLNKLLVKEKNINFFDKNKRSLLMYSCLINDNKIFDILLKKSQDYKHEDNLKNNALHYAVKFYGFKNYKNNFYKISKLIDKGIDIDSLNFFHQTPLIFAAIYNNCEIVELLCKNGANPNITNGWGDFTPLMVAVRLNRKDLVKTLLKKNVDIKMKNEIFGYSALDIAKTFNFSEIESMLKKYEFN